MGIRDTGGEMQMIVTVKKDELLKILETNRDTHKKDVEALQQAYELKTIELLKRIRKATTRALRSGDKEDLSNAYSDFSRLRKVNSHVVDYDRAIGMLKLHAKDELTLDSSSYRRYVEDEWDFSSEMRMSKTAYGIGV